MALAFGGDAAGVPRSWTRDGARRWRPVDEEGGGWLLELEPEDIWTLKSNGRVLAIGIERVSHPAMVDTWASAALERVRFVHDPLWLRSSSRDDPHDMEDLGLEFFMHKRFNRVLWYRDPVSGAVHHSGAKPYGDDDIPGRRYCAICRDSFSANNFVSQHMRNLHKEKADSRRQRGILGGPEGGVVRLGPERRSEAADTFLEYVDLPQLASHAAE